MVTLKHTYTHARTHGRAKNRARLHTLPDSLTAQPLPCLKRLTSLKPLYFGELITSTIIKEIITQKRPPLIYVTSSLAVMSRSTVQKARPPECDSTPTSDGPLQ